MNGLTLKLAWRNLARNRWRTALTAGGIAMAVMLVVWFSGMMEAFEDAMVGSFTDVELGSAQIHSAEYVEERSLYHSLEMTPDTLDMVRAVEGVKAVSGRIQAFGLIGHSNHSQIAKVMGVVASEEASVTTTASRVSSGAWLSHSPKPPPAAREVVIGKTLAKQLKVKPGDELVIFLTGADGSLGNDLLKVQGIVSTGNSALDRMAAYMHLEDAQYLTAMDGRIHEVAISAARGANLDAMVNSLQQVVGDKATVRSWKTITPDMAAMIEANRGMMLIFYLVIYGIAALGILNTQRMTALERRREFGVLMAIGTGPGQLARTVVAESVLLSICGAVLGGLLGLLLNYWFATTGWDLAAMSGGEGLDYMGVTIDVIYFRVHWEQVVQPLIALSGVGFVCGLWPAISSALVNVPAAIAGRN